tara:strand:+ start:1122 stop:1946 length:825 start_codon:yes stop_codon:yes gene_type:complete
VSTRIPMAVELLAVKGTGVGGSRGAALLQLSRDGGLTLPKIATHDRNASPTRSPTRRWRGADHVDEDSIAAALHMLKEGASKWEADMGRAAAAPKDPSSQQQPQQQPQTQHQQQAALSPARQALRASLAERIKVARTRLDGAFESGKADPRIPQAAAFRGPRRVDALDPGRLSGFDSIAAVFPSSPERSGSPTYMNLSKRRSPTREAIAKFTTGVDDARAAGTPKIARPDVKPARDSAFVLSERERISAKMLREQSVRGSASQPALRPKLLQPD